MNNKIAHHHSKGPHSPRRVDTGEFELPETVFVRNIDDRVFQSIVVQCLSKIDGVALAEGTFIDTLFNRASPDNIKGVYAEQDNKNHWSGSKLSSTSDTACRSPAKLKKCRPKSPKS